MPTEEMLYGTALNSWKVVIDRFTKVITPLSDEQLERQVAAGRNRLRYLVGHLTAIHAEHFRLLPREQ